MERICPVCGRHFAPVTGRHTFCTEVCRVRARSRSRSQPAKYGSQHRRLRAQLVPVVATGRMRCARCGEQIAPGEEWDLDHADGRDGEYLGPSHKSCHRATSVAETFDDDPAAGIYWGPPQEGVDGRPGKPTRWSRAWWPWRDEVA